jgi:hypothetical protein
MKGSLALWATVGFLAGCQTSNFAKSNSPATIQEEWVRHTPTKWEGAQLYAVRNIEFGYERGGGKHAPIIVDAGPSELWVWYYAHAGGLMDKMFDQTDPVILAAELAPSGHYKIHSEVTETTARFQLIDLQTGQVIITSRDVPLIVRASPLDSAKHGAVIPVFIPAHK